MTRNVAMPISEIKAMQARAKMRANLVNAPTVSADYKAEKIARAEKDILEASEKFASDIANAKKADISQEERDSLLKKYAELEDNETKQLNRVLLDARILLTVEEREAGLRKLEEQDADARKKYGIQPLEPEDIAQQNTDAVRHHDYVANKRYGDDRAAKYPPLGDVVDAYY